MIYFIGNGEHIKIGYSKDFKSLKTRFSALQTSCPFIIEIFSVLPGSITEEKKFHLKFKEFSTSGEWFVNSETIKDFINENKLISLFSKNIEKNLDSLTLNDLRKIKKLSLREVGQKMNISAQSVKEAEERYKSESITIKNLKCYANSIGYNVYISFSPNEQND